MGVLVSERIHMNPAPRVSFIRIWVFSTLVLVFLSFGVAYGYLQTFFLNPIEYMAVSEANQLAMERMIQLRQNKNFETMFQQVGPEFIDAHPKTASWANHSTLEHDTVIKFNEWETWSAAHKTPPLKHFIQTSCSRGTHVFIDGYTSIYSIYHDHRGMSDSRENIVLRVIGACREFLCRGLTYHHPKTDEQLDLLDAYCPHEHIPLNNRPTMQTVDATLLFREDPIEEVHPRRTDKTVKVCLERPLYDFEKRDDFEDLSSWTGVDPSLSVSQMTASTYRTVDKGEYEGLDYNSVYEQPQTRPKKSGESLILRKTCRIFPIQPTFFQFTYLPSDVTSNAPVGDEDINVNPSSAFFPKLLKFKGIKGGPHRKIMTEVEEMEYFYHLAIGRGEKPERPSSLDDLSIPRWNTFPTYPYDKDLLTAKNGYPDEFSYQNQHNYENDENNRDNYLNDLKHTFADENTPKPHSHHHLNRFGNPIQFANETLRLKPLKSPYWGDVTYPSPPMSFPSKKNHGIAMCLKGWWDGPEGKGVPKNLIEYFGYYKLMGVKKIFMYCPLDEKTDANVPPESWYETKKIRAEVGELFEMIRKKYSPEEFDVEIVCNNYGSVRKRVTGNGVNFGGEQIFSFEAQTNTNLDCHYRASKYLLVMPHVDVDEFIIPSVFSKEQFENPRSLFGLVMEETESGESRFKELIEKNQERHKERYDFFSFITYFPTSKLGYVFRGQLGLDSIERQLRDPRRGGYTAVKPTEKGVEVFTERLKKSVKRDENKFLTWVKSLTRSFPVGMFCGANTFHFHHWINRKQFESFPSAISLPYAQARPGHHFPWDRAKCLVLQTATPASTIHDMMHGGVNSVQLTSASLLMGTARTHHFRAPTREFIQQFSSRIREGHITDFSFWWYKKGVSEFASSIGVNNKKGWVDREVIGSNDADAQ
eukprot:GDKJ01005277.1.p1 GENE.GDKJ01005277.1~~GDKJ01005277.1.p1  ORF type:complete len:928 (-),score=153.01 GDKJ01005277.1:33-2816(-)